MAAPQPCRRRRRRCAAALAAAGCLLLQQPSTAAAQVAASPAAAAWDDFVPLTVFPNRFAQQPCSLSASSSGNKLADACSWTSLWGAVDGRVLVRPGEQNCTVTLRGCRPGLCYSFADSSAGGATDPLPGAATSIFSSLTLVSGGAVAGNSRTGFAFQASASQVVLQYSTHSCADYYAARGAVAYQLCDDYVGVTPVDVGMPSDPICTVTLPTSYA